MDTINTHATALVLNKAGVLLRGPSGAGKSLLALELLDSAKIFGGTGVLIADDRLDISVKSKKLYAHAPAEIAGLIELRGRGIVKRPHKQSTQIHLVVDLVEDMVRMVEEDELTTQIAGVDVPRCPVPFRSLIDSNHQRLLVAEALSAIGKGLG